MRSDKITKKTAKNALKMQFQSPISTYVYVFRYEKSEFGSILKPEVELMVFLRMRRKKSRKTAENVIKIQLQGVISVYICFSAR